MRRRLPAILLSLSVIACGAFVACGPDQGSLQYDHEGIVRGDVREKRLSLIFTGGEYAEGVPAILRVCKDRGLPASFFVTGDFLRLHADAAKSIVADKHLLGPHGDAHLLYCDWNDRKKTLVTRDAFRDDLRRNLDDLSAIGAPRSRYFVPPYEWFNSEQVAWAREMGLTLINFTPGSGSNRDYIPEEDSKFQSSSRLVDGILHFESTSPHGLNGFILLLHAGSKRQDKMHDQLDRLVAEIQHRGYTFVTLDDLLGG